MSNWPADHDVTPCRRDGDHHLTQRHTAAECPTETPAPVAFAPGVREHYITALDEFTGPIAAPFLAPGTACDAALARDLLGLDLDDWPAAREFVQRMLDQLNIQLPEMEDARDRS